MLSYHSHNGFDTGIYIMKNTGKGIYACLKRRLISINAHFLRNAGVEENKARITAAWIWLLRVSQN